MDFHMALELVHNVFQIVLVDNDNNNRQVYLSNFLQRMALESSDLLLPRKVIKKKINTNTYVLLILYVKLIRQH